MHSRLLPICFAAAMLALLALTPSGARATCPNICIVVTAGSDEATCPSQLTLRCAIIFANAHPFTNITFASNVPAVVLTGALPVISGDGTWIDGTRANNPDVRIDGAFWDTSNSNTGSAFTITGSNVTLSNLTVVNIPGGQADIRVNGGHNANIDNDFLGIQPGASQCGKDAPYGVLVDSDTAGTSGNGNGAAYIFGNTISCHLSYGIWVYVTNYVGIGVDEVNNMIGNKIGTTSDGLHPAGNYVGIKADTSQTLTIQSNLIADNATAGVTMNFGASFDDVSFNNITGNGGPGIQSGSGNSSNYLTSNNIGTNVTGTAVLPNGGDGIQISGGTGTFVSDNQIFYNRGKGVSVLNSGTQAQIQNNRIGGNGGLPIDLNGDGPSPNGAHSPPGPNAWLPYPTVNAVNGTSLFGFACSSCRVFVYRAIGNPQAPGGGGTPVTFVTADPSGAWAVNLPAGMSRADVTFAAVDTSNNTSEMSPRPQLMLPLLRR